MDVTWSMAPMPKTFDGRVPLPLPTSSKPGAKGLPESFAPGASVIVCEDGEYLARRSRDLQPGDAVVLPPTELVDEIARAMGWSGADALVDAEVDKYKKAVTAWSKGPGTGLGPQDVAERMEIAIGVPRPSLQAIRYWLSAGDHEAKARPFATRRVEWFHAFCRVIDYDPGASDAIIRHFDQHRGRLRREGRVRTGLVEKLLFDRFDSAIHHRLAQSAIDRFRTLALQHVRHVTSVEKGDLWEKGT